MASSGGTPGASADAGSGPALVVRRAWHACQNVRHNADAVRTAVALLDQCVVSGSRFATTLVIGRVCGPEELGLFSLAMTPVFILALVQEALVSTPFTVYLQKRAGRSQSRYAGSAVMMHAVLAATTFVVLLAATAALSWMDGFAKWVPLAAALAAFVPFTLLWELARRYYFARLEMGRAAVLDVAVATFQLAGLVFLAGTGQLSAVTALLVFGAGCSIVGLAWLAVVRRQLAFRLRAMGWHVLRHWRFGRWLFASQALGVVHGITPEWMLAAIVGAAATGTFAACHMLVLLPNPFIYGIGNLLVPRAAGVMTRRGPAATAAVVWRTTAAMTALLAVYAAVVAVGGDLAVRLMFGDEYGGYVTTVALLGLCPIAGAIVAGTSAGLMAIGRPEVVFQARIIGFVVTAVTTPVGVVLWGVAGAALGTALGNCAAAVVQAAMFGLLTASAGRRLALGRMPG